MNQKDIDTRREYRKKRRIRNQVISYSVLVVLLACIVFGSIEGVGLITKKLNAKAAAQEIVKEQIPEDTAAEAPTTDPVVPEVVEETTDPLVAFVDDCISQMTLEDKVAGLFLVSPESITGVTAATTAGSGTQEALTKYAVGGFVYTKKNIVNGDQLKEMLANTVAMSKYPMFYTVYEEGGDVTSLASAGLDVKTFDSMYKIGATADTANAYNLGNTIGLYLKDYGFNLDLAPVTDIVTSVDTSFMKERSFGSDPTVVGAMVSSCVQGFTDAGISSCLKHFPGQGNATEDTTNAYSVLDLSYKELQEKELIPFVEGIKAGAEFVMMSHVTVPQITGDSTPSSLSKAMITDVLRGDLGFDGVVITDALNKKAITDYYTTDQAAVMAIQAGADMIMLPDDFATAYQAILTAVQNGTITEDRINESLHRIYMVKYKNYLDK